MYKEDKSHISSITSNDLGDSVLADGINIPYTVDENGKLVVADRNRTNWWTNGFWPGLMWLMYIGTKNTENKHNNPVIVANGS